jgi:hypothetical protein
MSLAVSNVSGSVMQCIASPNKMDQHSNSNRFSKFLQLYLLEECSLTCEPSAANDDIPALTKRCAN